MRSFESAIACGATAGKHGSHTNELDQLDHMNRDQPERGPEN